MPYQPTNPYPYNTGVDLREGLILQFRVDNYDTIVKFEIEIYDLLKNEKVYTIIREIGDIETINEDKFLIEGDKQIIRILDNTDSLIYFDYYNGESVLPVVGGLTEENICKVELTNYLKTIEQVNYEYYYNRVTDFTDFTPTDSSDDSYYILDVNNYIVGIKEEYLEILDQTTKLIIPYQTQGKFVRGIGKKVFKNFDKLQEIILPSTIYSIEDESFANCSTLKKIILSYGISKIGENAFYGCVNLQEIELLDSIVSIGQSCFENCTKLTTLILSDSLKEIPNKCFYNNSSLVILNLKQIVSIGKEAFGNCNKISEIIFSEILENIGEYAFENCNNLVEVILPSTLVTINQGAFKGCNNIVEITLPFIGRSINAITAKEHVFGYIFGEVTTAEDGILQKYSDLENGYFAIPSTIAKVTVLNESKISYGAFYNCKEIIEIILNEGIKEIDNYAFYNCYNLVNVEIPSTVENIGDNVFSLEEVFE